MFSELEILFLFMAVTFLCVYVCVCVSHLSSMYIYVASITWHLQNATVTMGCTYFFWNTVFLFFRLIPKREIPGLYGTSSFNFLRNLHTVFSRSSTALQSHQQGIRIPFYTSSPYELFVIFLLIAILTGVRWYLIVVLIFISWMISNVVHLFMHLLTRVALFVYVFVC